MKPLFRFQLLLAVALLFLSNTLAHGQCLAASYPHANPPKCPNTGITPCLEQTNCNPTATYVGPPYLYGGDCTLAITRYLSRSVEMNFLSEFNYPSPCWGMNPLPSPNSTVNCTPPYTRCESFYCPDKYCQLINSLVTMNAQFVRGVYQGAGGREDIFFPGESWYCLGAQVVRDINYAYDCAGLRRPVIQANVSEIMNPDRFHFMDPNAGGWNDGIDRKIPPAVINFYFAQFPDDAAAIDPQSGLAYQVYYSTPRYFREDRIATISTPQGNRADITQVEMRIWFLYQAMTMIDFGYTAIHMGLYPEYAQKERVGNTGGLPVYHNLDMLTTAIRQYAFSCGEAGFVLLSGEPPSDKDNGLSAKAGGTDRFIFDFDSRAMRPREIANPPVSGEGDCDDPISQQVLDAYNSSPCGPISDITKLPAIVDPCVITNFGGTSGGEAPTTGKIPTGCRYEQIPYVVHYDGFTGVHNPNIPSNGDLTWGYDDHRWFEQLPEDCKEWWFNYFYCQRRNFDDGVGFMVVPGIINMNYVEVNGLEGEGHSDGKWLITDPGHENFITAVNNQAFLVEKPTLLINSSCTAPNGCTPTCNGANPLPSPYSYQLAGKYYTISVGNKDCSSVYSIHMKDPSGNWLPQTIGSELVFYPPVAGNYQIGIRQDNLGLPASTFGTYEVALTSHYMEPQCCQVIQAKDCVQYLDYSTTCISAINHVYKYNVAITTIDNSSNIQDVEALNNSKVESIQFVNSHKVYVEYTTDDPHPKLDLLVKILAVANPLEILLYKDLPVCPSALGLDDRNNAAEIESSSWIEMKVFPNPVENMLQVQVNSSNNVPAKVVVFNSLSAIQWSKEVALTKGDNNLSVDMSALPPGFYSVLVHTPETSRNAKFVKIRP